MINDGDFSAYASSSSFLLACNLMMRLNCSKITQGFPDGHWGRMTIYVRSAPEPLFSTWDVGKLRCKRSWSKEKVSSLTRFELLGSWFTCNFKLVFMTFPTKLPTSSQPGTSQLWMINLLRLVTVDWKWYRVPSLEVHFFLHFSKDNSFIYLIWNGMSIPFCYVH